MKTVIDIDPVCGREAGDSPFVVEHELVTYHFCGERCRHRFRVDPGEFIDDGMPAVYWESEILPIADPGRAGKRYGLLPFLTLAVVAALAGGAWRWPAPVFPSGALVWLSCSLGVFLVVTALLKLFDLGAFADRFQGHDAVARIFRPYAYVYPLIELTLALAFLAGWELPAICAITVAFGMSGALGILCALGGREAGEYCVWMGPQLPMRLSPSALWPPLCVAAVAGGLLVTLHIHP